MKRMKSEYSGDKGATPDRPGHTVKKPKEQQRTQNMHDKISQMITAGIQANKLIIDHEGDP